MSGGAGAKPTVSGQAKESRRALDHTARFVGIDVSKAHLDIAILPGPTTTRVANTPRGWQTLLRRLRSPAPVTIALEATGRYHRGATAALATAGHPAAVLNPAWTHAFARSEGRLAKTDRVDALVLARYAEQKQPAPTPVPAATTTAVVDLAAYREDLVAMRTMEQNRVQVMDGPVATFIAAHIADYSNPRIAADPPGRPALPNSRPCPGSSRCSPPSWQPACPSWAPSTAAPSRHWRGLPRIPARAGRRPSPVPCAAAGRRSGACCT